MRHGSLFSGIGGFDLAAEWMGWENVFHCEWNSFGQRVLHHYWPNAETFKDITKTDFKKYANTIDVLTGGFPCQPFSSSGQKKGADDERYLWGEMLRAIQEIKPTFVIAENVFGIVNIDGGLVFNQVCVDLEAEGYEVQPFVIGAASKNAPHRRYRCWFVGVSANSNGIGLERFKNKTQREHAIDGNTWDFFPTQSPVCSGDDGIPTELDGITFSKWRAESIKAYGNAIVPQVAYEIFKAITKTT